MFAVPSPRVAAEGSLKPHGPEPCGVTQVVQLPALHALDDRLCWPDCHSWAPCSGISVVPTGSADRHQILITLSNGLIFILQESWVNDIPSSTSENPPLKLDAQHSLQLTLDYRAKFRSIGLGSLNSNSKPNSSTSGMHPITKQNVMKTFGSSVLSTFHHIAPNGVQMLKVQPEVSESSGFGCLMSWLYEVDAPNKFRYKPENYQLLKFCLAEFNPFGVTVPPPPTEPRRKHLLKLLDNLIKILPALFERPTPCLFKSVS